MLAMLNISPAGFYLKVNKNDKIKLNQFGNIIEVGNEDIRMRSIIHFICFYTCVSKCF